MIIKYPTGLYATVLPQGTNSGDVTFTISNSTPPRTNLLYPKIPRGIVDKKRNPNALDRIKLRGSLGELVFSVSRASNTLEGNNTRQFEIGQVLEFTDSQLQVLDPMFVQQRSETRHDTNMFDYSELGLTNEEEQLLIDNSLVIHEQLLSQLNGLKVTRADAEKQINTQQKIINELQRNIAALQIVVDSSETNSDVQKIIDKFRTKLDTATAARDAAVIVANESAASAAAIDDKIRTISVVVK